MTENGAATTGIIGATCCRIICRSCDCYRVFLCYIEPFHVSFRAEFRRAKRNRGISDYKSQRFLDFACGFARNDTTTMKLVIAATGASGTIYLQRLLAQIDCSAHEVHLVMSASARDVAKQEIDDFKTPSHVSQHAENDMNVPFVSGSARFDAMVIVPCSMATLGRIASG